ncbi:hypothetical protein GBA63_02355 [Rubrobacter tropicus]|uniref:Uncharacterized protein n=1 Tax=Rubrobacter tropicus TaxID=2653851 RepID=A0A6G8Q5J6_9ACTN|nr:hypothetical protein [Rubrobacter tropicus]QIN81597.1 hypothetical protein GBA63_02355 [Rubrobacter tropicus]
MPLARQAVGEEAAEQQGAAGHEGQDRRGAEVGKEAQGAALLEDTALLLARVGAAAACPTTVSSGTVPSAVVP